jgi:hypothetical protein
VLEMGSTSAARGHVTDPDRPGSEDQADDAGLSLVTNHQGTDGIDGYVGASR